LPGFARSCKSGDLGLERRGLSRCERREGAREKEEEKERGHKAESASGNGGKQHAVPSVNFRNHKGGSPKRRQTTPNRTACLPET
jgi:hypothetical protein